MLDAAVTVFSRRGYHAAVVDEIAEVAGISKPMVYAYLGSKEELFIACLHREGTRLIEAIAAASSAPIDRDVPPGPDVVAGPGAPAGPGVPPGPADPGVAVPVGELPLDLRLWRGLRAFFGFVAAHRDGWAVLYRQARGQEPFAEVLGEMRARMVEIVAGMLADEVAPGRPDGPDVEILAQAVVGAAEALADRIVDRADRAPETMATQVMGAVWVGVGAMLRGATWEYGLTG
jgi:AcrR family transcriptional regulator